MNEPKFRPLLAITIFIIASSFCWGVFSSFVAGKFSLLQAFLLVIPGENLVTDTNILLLGKDATEGVQRSDTIILIRISPGKKAVSVISIPRDLLVLIPGMGMDKVNHAYAYGGVDLSKKTVSTFLGLPIDDYILIDIQGLMNIIDYMGGITIDVEKRMYYVDRAGDLFIDLKPGPQRLNGSQAMGYVRFRHDAYGDMGRITRQQKFLEAFARELTQAKNIVKMPVLLHELASKIKTNLATRKILSVAAELKMAYELGNIQMYVIPGSEEKINGIYYIRPDPWGTQRILQNILSGPNGKTLKDLRLEVLNGTGQPGLAHEVASRLDAKGIQIVHIGDADNFFYNKTLLLDWDSKKRSVQTLANLLRIDQKQIMAKATRKKGRGIDVTLTLGKDWLEKLNNL